MATETLTYQDMKTDAMVSLIEAFRAGEALTTNDIAARFGVSQRTAQRWVVHVQKWVPLVVDGRTWRAKAAKR